MKLSNVKTVADFDIVADCWYQRTMRMAEIWGDDTETEKRKEKAIRIWKHYSVVVLKLTKIANEIHFKTFSKNNSSPIGGIFPNNQFTAKEGEEMIIRKSQR